MTSAGNRSTGRRRRDQRGTMTLEVVLLAPIFVALLALMFALGRWAQTESLVDQAARDAARAATAQNSRAQAPVVAAEVVSQTLADAPSRCQETATPRFTPSSQAFELVEYGGVGQSYSVTVTCDVDLGELGLFFWPADVTIEQTFTSPLDRYRGYVP
jgi:Flp pilus assembly protein TadG